MQVSVETLKGLERKMTISVPAEKVEEEVSLRLKTLAHKVKIDGFRPGKVPFEVVKKRYSDSVRAEVAQDMVQSTLREALTANQLVPAGYPEVEPEQLEAGKDFRYTATFEIFPEIKIEELNQDKVDQVLSEVKDNDIEKMVENLREQNKNWEEVSRPAAQHDKVILDFEGFIDDEPFEGGKAVDYEVVIGSGAMIPGFESGLVGAESGKKFDIKVNFPQDYGHKELASKEAVFKISAKKILEGKLPELNDEFAEKFGLQQNSMVGLKEDIKQNMTRELERRLSSINREKMFDKLLEKNPFDLPNALINQEIEHLKHDMFHRIFGSEHHENEKIPDFPRELFEKQAQRRVHLGLLFSEYVKKHNISASKERVDAMIDKMASAYEKPEELRSWYYERKERLADVEALVMEEIVAEKIAENASVVEKSMNYDDVMNPARDNEEKGA